MESSSSQCLHPFISTISLLVVTLKGLSYVPTLGPWGLKCKTKQLMKISQQKALACTKIQKGIQRSSKPINATNWEPVTGVSPTLCLCWKQHFCCIVFEPFPAADANGKAWSSKSQTRSRRVLRRRQWWPESHLTGYSLNLVSRKVKPFFAGTPDAMSRGGMKTETLLHIWGEGIRIWPKGAGC